MQRGQVLPTLPHALVLLGFAHRLGYFLRKYFVVLLADWVLCFVFDSLLTHLYALCVSALPCSTGANGAACQNDGTATGTTGNCGCNCAPGYNGLNCETGFVCVIDVSCSTVLFVCCFRLFCFFSMLPPVLFRWLAHVCVLIQLVVVLLVPTAQLVRTVVQPLALPATVGANANLASAAPTARQVPCGVCVNMFGLKVGRSWLFCNCFALSFLTQ